MFRHDYPDAPGLFSGLRRPLRLTVWSAFRRSWILSTFGLFLVTAGLVSTVWNEGEATAVASSLDEGHRIHRAPDSNAVVFEENNGKLLLIHGDLNVEDRLGDEKYGVSVNAVKLKKVVQMFQWFEVEDPKPDPPESDDHHDRHREPTYSYARDWFDKRIDSESFRHPMGHHNPEEWPSNSSVTINKRVKIGGYLLGKELKDKFSNFVPFTSDERPSNPDIKMHAGLYFHAKNVWEPEVGDVRIQFSYAGKHADLYTVVGAQSGREIRPFYSESGARELLFLHSGIKSSKEVFQSEHAQNRIRRWASRIGGWFLCFVGLNCLSQLMDVVVDSYPYIRGVFVLGAASLPFSLSVSLSLLSIGVGWLMYSPAMGLLLSGVGLSPVLLAFAKVYRQRNHQHVM